MATYSPSMRGSHAEFLTAWSSAHRAYLHTQCKGCHWNYRAVLNLGKQWQIMSLNEMSMLMSILRMCTRTITGIQAMNHHGRLALETFCVVFLVVPEWTHLWQRANIPQHENHDDQSSKSHASRVALVNDILQKSKGAARVHNRPVGKDATVRFPDTQVHADFTFKHPNCKRNLQLILLKELDQAKATSL